MKSIVQNSQLNTASHQLEQECRGEEEVSDTSAGNREEWIQCERCDKWRKLPSGETAASLHLEEEWHCGNSPWDRLGSCAVPEEAWSDDEGNGDDRVAKPFGENLVALRHEVSRAKRKHGDLGVGVDCNELVRISVQQTLGLRFKGDSERMRTALVSTEVTIDHEQTPSSRGHAFDWAQNHFYEVVAEDKGGSPFAVNKEFGVCYEIWDISEGESNAVRIHSTTSKKTWQRKYFWFNAVTFLQPGSYLLRFSPACKKYEHVEPMECRVSVRTCSAAAIDGNDESVLDKKSNHAQLLTQGPQKVFTRTLQDNLLKQRQGVSSIVDATPESLRSPFGGMGNCTSSSSTPTTSGRTSCRSSSWLPSCTLIADTPTPSTLDTAAAAAAAFEPINVAHPSTLRSGAPPPAKTTIARAAAVEDDSGCTNAKTISAAGAAEAYLELPDSSRSSCSSSQTIINREVGGISGGRGGATGCGVGAQSPRPVAPPFPVHGGDLQKLPDVHFERFEVTFTAPSLGLGLKSGDGENDLSIVTFVSPALVGTSRRPTVGDLVETVGGVVLTGCGGAHSRAIELVKEGRRPITIGFIAQPTTTTTTITSPTATTTTTYDLDFDSPRLDISIKNQNQNVVVVGNRSGRLQSACGDYLAAINGEKLEDQESLSEWAMKQVKNGTRSLTPTFETTVIKGAQAAVVPVELVRKEPASSNQGDSGGSGGDKEEWVQCERCDKWRKLPLGETAALLRLEEEWHCENSSWDRLGSCAVPEEAWSEDAGNGHADDEPLGENLMALRSEASRAKRECADLGLDAGPVRISVQQTSERRFKGDSERVRTTLIPTEVAIDHEQMSSSGGDAFEWAQNQFYAVVAEDEENAPCSLGNELRVRYEIWDISEGEVNAVLMFSTTTNQPWKRKYFWFSAVNFLQPGSYLLRFSPACKKYEHLEPVECRVFVRTCSAAAIDGNDESTNMCSSEHKRKRAQLLVQGHKRKFIDNLPDKRQRSSLVDAIPVSISSPFGGMMPLRHIVLNAPLLNLAAPPSMETAEVGPTRALSSIAITNFAASSTTPLCQQPVSKPQDNATDSGGNGRWHIPESPGFVAPATFCSVLDNDGSGGGFAEADTASISVTPHPTETLPSSPLVEGNQATYSEDDMELLRHSLARAEKERDDVAKERDGVAKKYDTVLAHAEMLDSMVPTLEAMRSEMKELLLQSKSALLEAGTPKRQKTDKYVPYWYGEHSWAGREDVPWNEDEKRAMTPAEGIQWLAAELQKAKGASKRN